MNEVLVHHGIKGMHWGIRRYQNKDGSLTKAGLARAKQQAEDAERERRERLSNAIEAETLKKKAQYKEAARLRRSLSDEELVARIGRLEKEKKLRDLTRESLDERSDARKALDEALLGAGKKVVGTAVAGGTLYLGKAILTKSFDKNEASAYIFANPNKKK